MLQWRAPPVSHPAAVTGGDGWSLRALTLIPTSFVSATEGQDDSGTAGAHRQSDATCQKTEKET